MQYGKTKIVLCNDEVELGRRAASDVSGKMRELLMERDEIRVVFSSAESQMAFFDALAQEEGVNWQQIVCFNVDDFHDVRMPETYTCGYLTKKMLYDKVNPMRVHLIRYNATDPHEEAERFAKLLEEEGDIDILCLGIGTSGHLALNEPFDTDFNEKEPVKVVDVVEQSKIQLMNDPHFKALGYIPEKGITLTIPTLLSAKNIYTMVPLSSKRPILEKLFTLDGPTTALPASILHQVDGTLYIDRNSCPPELLSN